MIKYRLLSKAFINFVHGIFIFIGPYRIKNVCKRQKLTKQVEV